MSEKIYYLSENSYCFTPCEFFKKIMVGSINCQDCNYYENCNIDNKYIICNFRLC